MQDCNLACAFSALFMRVGIILKWRLLNEMSVELESDEKSVNDPTKGASAFALLIESGAIAFVRSIQIVPVNSTEFEFRCLFKTKYDGRSHLLRQVMENSTEAYLVADTLIDIHLAENEGYEEIMAQWRAKLENKDMYSKAGVSVFCM